MPCTNIFRIVNYVGIVLHKYVVYNNTIIHIYIFTDNSKYISPIALKKLYGNSQ